MSEYNISIKFKLQWSEQTDFDYFETQFVFVFLLTECNKLIWLLFEEALAIFCGRLY